MTNWLKQSTAVVIPFGPFVDKTDGVTPETGLVSALDHGSTGIMLSKNGGAKAVRHATVTATTYDAYGDYRVTLDTTDTNTLGSLRVSFIETATCLPVWRDFMVVPANVWDSMFGADALQVHANEITAGLITAAAIADNAIDAGAIASDAITAAKIATGAITAAKFAAGAIDAAAIADNAIDAGAIAADAITAAKIADGAIDAGAIASDAITAAKIAAGAITSAKFAAGAITAAAIATDAIDADALAADAVTEIAAGFAIPDGALTEAKFSSGGLNAIADAVLKRDWTAVSGEGARSALNALRFLRNKWSVSAGTLTVTKENDTTAAWTAVVTDDAGADPITGVDPA